MSIFRVEMRGEAVGCGGKTKDDRKRTKATDGRREKPLLSAGESYIIIVK